jgi:dephospho-CoA kinase
VLRVALTGGIATGKSYCLARFAALGVPVLDADVLARDATGPGTNGLEAIIRRFGRGAVTGTGLLDRASLARIVFADSAARRDLEAIIHPIVYRRIAAWYAELDAALPFETPATAAAAGGPPGFAVADIPLLYETERESEFDRVIVAACGAGQQLARLMARDGLTEHDARQRIAAQTPIDDKRRRADYVIDTGGTTDETDRQVAAVFDRLRAEAAGAAMIQAG